MADKTIQELPQASTLTGNELILLEQNAEAKKASSSAFTAKVAEDIADTQEFEQQITDAVDAWLDEHGIDSDFPSAAKVLLITILRNALYKTDQSVNISALEAAIGAPADNITLVNGVLTILALANDPVQSGAALTIS